jgi:hypothetical protein
MVRFARDLRWPEMALKDFGNNTGHATVTDRPADKALRDIGQKRTPIRYWKDLCGGEDRTKLPLGYRDGHAKPHLARGRRSALPWARFDGV